MAKKKLKTYGEYLIWRRENMMSDDGLAWFPSEKHRPKMTQDEAMAYYNMKLHDAWFHLGYYGNQQVERTLWKDFWHSAESIVKHLPLNMQESIREVFAYGYVLGYEKGKESK